MPSKYKCPVCGCTEYFPLVPSRVGSRSSSDSKGNGNPKERSLIDSDLSIDCAEWLSIREFNIKLNAEVCMCKNCAHIDLFGEDLLKNVQNDNEIKRKEIEQKENELSVLKQRKAELEKELAQIRSREEEIVKLLKNEEITVKQHNQLLEESKIVGKKRPLLEKELKKIEPTIYELEQELTILKKWQDK